MAGDAHAHACMGRHVLEHTRLQLVCQVWMVVAGCVWELHGPCPCCLVLSLLLHELFGRWWEERRCLLLLHLQRLLLQCLLCQLLLLLQEQCWGLLGWPLLQTCKRGYRHSSPCNRSICT